MPEALKRGAGSSVSLIEYRTMKQYRPLGDALDEFKTYGFRAGVENIISSATAPSQASGHNWLTAEFDAKDLV